VPGSLGLQGVPDIIQSDGTVGSVMGVPFYSATRAGEFYSFGYVPGIYVPNAGTNLLYPSPHHNTIALLITWFM